jgi:CubicO group peptidase (beta-lactamase class C family)
MRLLPGLALVTAVLAVSTASARQDVEFTRLAERIQRTKDATKQPSGTAIAVVRDGEIVYEGYFGYADIGNKVPVTRDTVFYLASATKPFFALDALLLADAGKLDTAASLQDLFADVTFSGFDASSVSIKELLTHASGLDNQALVWATAFSGIHDAGSRYRLVAASYPDADAARGTFRYSNVGYNIVSVALDRRLGTPWQEQLDANIFTPLGMRHTTAYVSEATGAGWRLAKPYSIQSGQRDRALYLEKADETMHAAGGMLSTAPDLARFLMAQLADGRLDGEQRLRRSVIERSHVQQVATDGAGFEDFERTGYAWGWYLGDYKQRRMLHHFGGFAGFHAHLSFIPEANVGLVVLNNEDFLAAKLTSLIADGVYGQLLHEADTESRVEARFDALLEKAKGLEAAIAAQREKIGSRAWDLSLPRPAYVGTYAHPLLGNATVSLGRDDQLRVSWGRVASDATAYEGRDQMRVEFVPNSGQVIAFDVDDDRVVALEFDGMRFSKVP